MLQCRVSSASLFNVISWTDRTPIRRLIEQMVLRAAKRINDINALTERKDAGNTAASSSAHPSASSTCCVSKKRTLESLEDAGGK